MKDETKLIVLQMQGDKLRKSDKYKAYSLYSQAATLAENMGKPDTAKCIREKMESMK